MAGADLVKDLKREVGTSAVLVDPASLTVYARDASHQAYGRPLCVVLPETPEALRRVVAACARHRRPFVVRGGGTGLSGGALPADGAVVIATSRLQRLDPVDPDRRRVRVEPGVLNEAVSRHAASCGLYFAPDPSSQAAATIGGNVAENAGGPHCLKVGVTAQHVRRLEWIDPQGRLWSTGRGGALDRGIGLRGLLCGSEGTLGVVASAELDLLPLAEATVTLLAEFPRLSDATRAVVDLMTSGVLPEACEIVDRVMLEAVEAAFRFGFATDVDAVMICEVAGRAPAAAEDAARAERLLQAAGARRVRAARDADERARLWQCRKRAFGAVGRLAPAYVAIDVVVPLGELTGLVEDIAAIKAEHRVEIATVFHAGDGNLHPGVHYDDRDADLIARAQSAADAIVLGALARGGSCTGEHGVGLEKRHLVHRQLDRTSLRLMQGIKDLFDPDDLCNPGKALPRRELAAAAAITAQVPGEVSFRWDSLTVTAPARTPLAELQAEAATRGLWIPLGAASRSRAVGPGLGGALTVGDVIEAGTSGPSLLGHLWPADAVLELWAGTGDGEILRAGAPVLKNVAGYDLVRLIVGSGGILARPLAATLQLKPAPECVELWTWSDVPGAFTAEERRDFVRVLRSHPQPAVVVRERAASGPSLWVAAAGRDREWDLGRLGADLAAWSEDHGLAQPVAVRRTGAALASPALLADLPAWAVASADWTLLTPRDRQPDWPRPRRLIWQSRPVMLWTPEIVAEEPVGWFADGIFRDGRLQLPPQPAAGVPLPLLAGLKRLFDPQGRLPCPDWLKRHLEAAAA
ncbi:MAG TPA: FAD-linked oxidase C-terminal domain-containing protein [Candidatus Krumholzibacteria bacterium]|nr:FAD-linked oxidase C-terminal domain-containing protein [Candidatus Krumholzibacteria bacterium]HPD70997.1 FAD-linked oxidase C-terminal domain-containing protein [Candidatus Krumholzibacteria bacterium]HRY39303.1 FAD-linked oxidase C-terminal domain-containing protein [Candidatus Krumholzibacteria bacterium]